MSRRHPMTDNTIRTPKRTASKLHASTRKALEPLESRTLLTTVITDTDPLTPTPNRVSFEYKDARNNNVRVVVFGDVSAEFIFTRVSKGNDGFSPNRAIFNQHVVADSKEDGRDLFHVFVAQATIDSYISIAEVPGLDDTPRPMDPFSGNVTLVIQQGLRTNEVTRATDGGTGNIILGARTRDTPLEIENEADRPLISIGNFNGFGLMPPTSSGRLSAGLSTANGVSLGRFLFGGLVMGAVTIRGSMDSFYCGQLWTGAAQGQFFGDPTVPGNFTVLGDIRNILSKGSIGTNTAGIAKTPIGRGQPTYFTGVDFEIKGRVGQIRTGGDYLAYARVRNTNPGLGLRTRQQEIEFAIDDTNPSRGDFTDFEDGMFGDNETFFDNDSFQTAQFLGSINSRQTGNDSIQVNGRIQAFVNWNDVVDYYAVPLMAGQRVTARVIAPEATSVGTGTEIKSQLHLGVFDPEQRLIASDWSNTDDMTSNDNDTDPAQQELFAFTASKPGIYRFAVTQDAGFEESGNRTAGEVPYQLQITGVGNIAAGGLVAEGTIIAPSTFFNTGVSETRANLQTIEGDLGAVYSISDFIIGFGGTTSINALAQRGNVRAVDAASLGTVEGAAGGEDEALTFRYPVAVQAYAGSVGMVRGLGADRSTNSTFFNFGPNVLENIGRDVQWIVAPNTLVTDLAANGNIGVVQVGQFGVTNYAGSLSADADGVGAPGTIDLIDVTLGLGTGGAGGPLISAGPFGNVRYIHLEEAAQIWRPAVFGGGSPEDTTLTAGQAFEFTDDSGANVRIVPTREELLDDFGLPIFGLDGLPIDNSGTLTILTYPIAQSVTNPFGSGGGGLVLVRATSTRGMLVQSDGPTELGDLVSTGSGPALVIDPEDPLGEDGLPNTGDEEYLLDPFAFEDNSINLRQSGSRGVIDVFSLRGNNFNYIRNQTSGEIVTADIGAVGRITANNIGWARSTVQANMAVERSVATNVFGHGTQMYPYFDTKNVFIIDAGGETQPAALDISVKQAIGHLAIRGISDRIVANADGENVQRQFEGINGAVYIEGQMRFVNVGEGLLPTGTGEFAWAGLYCVAAIPGSNGFTGVIELVVADKADIRGDIASNTAIRRVSVTNGSLINADIWVIHAVGDAVGNGNDLIATREIGGGGTISTVEGDATLGNIGRVTTSGNGGIIGANFLAANIGPVTSAGGFGIFNSEWITTGVGRFSEISADGYGIRGAVVNGGQSLDGMRANTRGGRLNTLNYNAGVRLSEVTTIDPYFGTKPNPLTDLHVVLGTTKDAPVRQGTSNGGQIDFVTVGVSRDMGYLRANTVRVSEFNVPNQLRSFATNDYVNDVKIVTGRSDIISIGRDAIRLQMDAAGDVKQVAIGGSFRGSSGFRSGGYVGDFVTRTTLYGNIYSLRGFGAIRVGTDYGSQGSRTAGSVGRFVTNGNLLTQSLFTVGKDVGQLIIGGDVEDGALFKIEGTLGTKTVIGDEVGEIIVV